MNDKLENIISIIKSIKTVKRSFIEYTDSDINYNSELIKMIYNVNRLMSLVFTEDESYTEYFLRISSQLLELENKKSCISKQVVSDWIASYRDVIAVKLIAEISTEIDDETKFEIADFYDESEISTDIKAVAYFSVSEMFRNADAGKSYEYGIKAFELNPEVCGIFDVKKRFEVDNIENNYYTSCPICSSANVRPYKKINQFYAVDNQKCFLPVKLWMKCDCCTNLFAYNFPVNDMNEINGHYTRNNKSDSIVPRNCLAVYTDIFNKCIQYTEGKKYLEIGVGNGEMLAAALEFGFDVSAIEICKEDCEKISSVLGIDIMWADFLDAGINDKFDLIIMGDVLEHVSRPYDAILKARDLLSDDGVLWISTPNYESGFTILMKDNDPMWNQLNHFTYFSYKGIEKVLTEAGLHIMRYDASSRYNGSMELYIKKEK